MKEDLSIFEGIVSSRKTTKVMAERDLPDSQKKELIDRILACAGWAPFHRACDYLHRPEATNASVQPTGIEPWRFHMVDSENCRRLRALTSTMEAAGKIPAMLASASAVAIATWLPNPLQQSQEKKCDPASTNSNCRFDTSHAEYFEPTVENVEHIAAASAAVQSLLLAATAAGLLSYWSSGGVLRSPVILDRLAIPLSQRVLGVIFLFPTTLPDSSSVQIVGSKLRVSRGGLNAWSRWVSISEP